MTEYARGELAAFMKLQEAWYGKPAYFANFEENRCYSDISKKELSLRGAQKEFEETLRKEGRYVRINENFNH